LSLALLLGLGATNFPSSLITWARPPAAAAEDTADAWQGGDLGFEGFTPEASKAPEPDPQNSTVFPGVHSQTGAPGAETGDPTTYSDIPQSAGAASGENSVWAQAVTPPPQDPQTPEAATPQPPAPHQLALGDIALSAPELVQARPTPVEGEPRQAQRPPGASDERLAQGLPTAPAPIVDPALRDDPESMRAHQVADDAGRQADDFSRIAASTDAPVDGARANLAGALAEAARALAGAVDNAVLAKQNGITEAGRIAELAQLGVGAARAGVINQPQPPTTRLMSQFAWLAADNAKNAARYASTIAVAGDDRTARGRSQAAWAAQAAANAAQAAANAAWHATLAAPGDPLVQSGFEIAQRSADEAAAAAVTAAIRLGRGNGGAES